MKKVFLIEDDHYVSRMYERAFRLHGYEIVLAFDGADALKQLATMNPVPDAIMLDIRIPTKDGATVLTEIRANSAYDAVPVIILTNSLRDEERDRFLALGADSYLIKMNTQSKEVLTLVDEFITSGRTKKQTA